MLDAGNPEMLSNRHFTQSSTSTRRCTATHQRTRIVDAHSVGQTATSATGSQQVASRRGSISERPSRFLRPAILHYVHRFSPAVVN
jgi:hypothetical protein